MAKPHSFTGNLQGVARMFTTSSSHHNPKPSKPLKSIPVKPREVRVGVEMDALKLKKKMEESSSSAVLDGRNRVPLSQVVSECLRRWFQDTLKEAKDGDTAMQVLVGQMYFNGYGVPKDPQKGLAWINRASKRRASVWKVSDKRPGYNASDSDSEEEKDDGIKMR